MSKFDTLYAKLPVFAQHLAVSSYGYYWHWLRFGDGYSGQLRNFNNREKFTHQDWEIWTKLEVKKLLTSAFDHVPYYKNAWNDNQKQAAYSGDISSLPLLEKAEIRNQPRAFIRQDLHPYKDYTFYTSGTSGTPIATIWTREEIRASLAVREDRSASWAGVSFSLPRATFSGRMVEPDPLSKGPFYRFNLAEKQVYLSPFHLRPDTAQKYVDAIRKHKVEWLTGYAVSLYLLGKMIIDKNIPVPPLKAIITTSEKVTLEMRQVMKKAFGCRVYEEYSTVENALFASECEYGRLHVSPDIGIIEILRSDGSYTEPGEIGEVVATCLLRKYQIFIRYRIGDLAAWDPEPCPCGRVLPVIKEVVGRIEDVVIGPDGRLLVRFHGVFINQPHVMEGQIIQKELNHIHVKIIPTNGFNSDDVKEIIYRVHQRLGNSVKVTVEQVIDIPRTKSGKFKAVISELGQRDLG